MRAQTCGFDIGSWRPTLCTDMFTDMYIDTYMDLRIELCIGMCIILAVYTATHFDVQRSASACACVHACGCACLAQQQCADGSVCACMRHACMHAHVCVCARTCVRACMRAVRCVSALCSSNALTMASVPLAAAIIKAVWKPKHCFAFAPRASSASTTCMYNSQIYHGASSQTSAMPCHAVRTKKIHFCVGRTMHVAHMLLACSTTCLVQAPLHI